MLFLLQAPTLPQRTLVEELRITSPGPDLDFVALAGIAEGRDRIYLSDWRAPAIHYFDTAGRYLGQVGRAGDGPGEYRIPVSIGVRGDTLWLWDPTQQRITLWNREGKVLRSTAILGGDGYLGNGTYLADGSVATIPSWTSARVRTGLSPEAVRRFGTDGRLQDTLLMLPISGAGLKIETGSRIFIVGDQPFTDAPLLVAALDGSGFVRVDRATTGPAEIGLVRYDHRGRVLWRRAVPYLARPVEPTVVDSVIRSYTQPPDSRSTAAPEDRVRAAVTIPPRGVPVLAALLGSDGRIWLRRPAPAGRPGHFLVLRPDGQPEFELDLPPRSRLAAASATTAWLVESDEDDVQSAVRYRIVR